MAAVVSTEYEDLQRKIFSLQEEWKKSLNPNAFTVKEVQTCIKQHVPVLTQTTFHFNIPLFSQWLDELVQVLCGENGERSGRLAHMKSIMNEEIALRWLEEALVVNQSYFTRFATEHDLDVWVPQFFAETTVRPYILLLAEQVQDQLCSTEPGGGCPVCGEPVRLAIIETSGKKTLHCPRCLAHWYGNRLICAHCGNTNHQTMNFLEVEENPAEQIQVCEACGGYTKIIDMRQTVEERPTAALLDLLTIHLDYIAQENGYKAMGETNPIH